jgi:hypothetical protein
MTTRCKLCTAHTRFGHVMQVEVEWHITNTATPLDRQLTDMGKVDLHGRDRGASCRAVPMAFLPGWNGVRNILDLGERSRSSGETH